MTQHIPTCSLHTARQQRGEIKLLIIIVISLFTMVGEIIGGTVFGSMALLADGWHMGTHVIALGIAFAACVFIRKIAADHRFGFGPAKVSALGGFTGAILLGMVAFEMIGEGLLRLLTPEQIQYTEAMIVAVIGLLVNSIGALLLHEGAHAGEPTSDHAHSHPHRHTHSPGQTHTHDTNMQSAYLHVITDALTSVLAIAALFLGKQFGWVWADAAVAMLGGALILKWAFGLLKTSGAALLDFVPNAGLHREVKEAITGKEGNDIQDIHIWPQEERFGVLATVTAHHRTYPAAGIHQRLNDLGYLSHVTIEVRSCDCC